MKKELGKVTSDDIKLKKEIDSASEVTSGSVKQRKKKRKNIENRSAVDIAENIILNVVSSWDQVFCSLCGMHIPNYTPKYFMGEEDNAACLRCEDKDNVYDKEAPISQKVVLTKQEFNSTSSEPFSPQLPALAPLKNELSNHCSYLEDDGT